MNTNQHNIIGTTIYIGKSDLETEYGSMTAYTFQDLIHKGYIIALAHGDIHAPLLYTRLHSSCVTSQLMRSLDCDCVQQLNGAIKKICEGNGILFYLIQEGRGCGYVGKSRACMTVQYFEEKKDINTFEAYEMLGMQHDYRQYTCVKDITKILGINSEFILLTNNPDKIEKFSKLGIPLKKVESIQVAPNPFNQTYLMSKQQYGHILYEAKTKVQSYVMPYERLPPFTPYSLPSCQRFVHVSTYYLPIKPVYNRIVLTQDQYEKYCQESGNTYQIIKNPAKKNEIAYYTQMSQEEIRNAPEHFKKPNWFQINVHYDIVTNQDYLLLKYGNPENNQVPIVRIHSESLFNRFPVVERQYKERYKTSMDMIIRNGYGYILIFYNDGRGSGLGYYILNSEAETQQHLAMKRKPSKIQQDFIEEKTRHKIGVQDDKRDYFGAINLLGHYIGQNSTIDLACGETSLPVLKKFFENSKKFNVRKYIQIWNQSLDRGVLSIDSRIRSCDTCLEHLNTNLNQQNLGQVSHAIKTGLQSHKNVFSTGIGSSEAHSKGLSALFGGKIKHVNPMNLNTLKNYGEYLLIVYSQGLSPNIIYCLKDVNLSNVVFITSVDITKTITNVEKQKFIEKIAQSKSLMINYQTETPDDTLIRVTGPYIVFYINSILYELTQSQQNVKDVCQKHWADYQNRKYSNLSYTKMNQLIINLSVEKNLIICCDYPAIDLVLNSKFKFIEGAMVNTQVVDYVNFAHGTYQFLESQKDKHCIWFITQNDSKLHEKTVEMVEADKEKVYVTTYSKEQIEFLPLKLQAEANYIVFQLIQMLGINQLNWPGKDRQSMLYEVYQ